jgi:hypothetical protein
LTTKKIREFIFTLLVLCFGAWLGTVAGFIWFLPIVVGLIGAILLLTYAIDKVQKSAVAASTAGTSPTWRDELWATVTVAAFTLAICGLVAALFWSPFHTGSRNSERPPTLSIVSELQGPVGDLPVAVEVEARHLVGGESIWIVIAPTGNIETKHLPSTEVFPVSLPCRRVAESDNRWVCRDVYVGSEATAGSFAIAAIVADSELTESLVEYAVGAVKDSINGLCPIVPPPAPGSGCYQTFPLPIGTVVSDAQMVARN